MPYFSDLNTYLHNSSLLLQAYPSARITTKYSLPKKSRASKPTDAADAPTQQTPTVPSDHTAHEKRQPSSTLILKTFHPESGICLKYKTDKAAEVGRLMTGLGRLAAGEVIEMPSAAAAEKMDVDVRPETPQVEEEVKAERHGGGPGGGGGGGGAGKGKKKKGKK